MPKIPYSSVWQWTGFMGSRSKLTIPTYAGPKEIDAPRGLPPIMFAGGYQAVFDAIWSKVFALGCRGLMTHLPWGAPWWGAGIVGKDDGGVMEWDGMLHCEADLTLDGQYRPVLPVNVNRHEFVRVMQQCPKGTQRMIYYGHPAMSTAMLRLREAGMTTEYHARAEGAWWAAKQLRSHVAVDSFGGPANLTDLETTFLSVVRHQVEGYGGHFVGEEAWAVWNSGSTAAGLTTFDAALANGRVPAGRTGYAFDQEQLAGQALIDQTRAVMYLGYVPMLDVLELATAQGDLAGVS